MQGKAVLLHQQELPKSSGGHEIQWDAQLLDPRKRPKPFSGNLHPLYPKDTHTHTRTPV
jgi:hypothetical protein